MKKWIKKISCFLIASLFLPNLPAGAVAVQTINTVSFSDKDYIFRIKGSTQDFLLLDETDDNNSKFFVYAIGYYGRKAWHSGNKQKFDPRDKQSMAYFLNNDFLTKGNLSGFRLEYLKLPEPIIKHIDFNHVWDCEEGKAGGDAATPYKITCGIVLPSQTELVKYADKVGWDDEYRSFKNDVTLYPWGTRATGDSGEILAVRPNVSTTQLRSMGETSGLIGIRPAFYLDLNFFKEIRLDTEHTGGKVMENFKKYYTIDDMKKLYTEQECYDFLGYSPDIKLSYAEGKCELSSNVNHDTDGILVTIYYDDGNVPVGQTNKSVSLAAKGKTSVDNEVKKAFENAKYAKISVFEADDSGVFRVVSNSKRIDF